MIAWEENVCVGVVGWGCIADRCGKVSGLPGGAVHMRERGEGGGEGK